MDQPLVSIIALNYNQSEYLVESLDAIAGQIYRNFELIITDDCSSDDSRVKIDFWVSSHPELKITKVYNETNIGLCKTLNKAIALSRGEFIKPIACDDILLKNYLNKVIKKFSNTVSLVFTDMEIVNEIGVVKQNSNYKYNGVNPLYLLNKYEALLDAQYISAPTIIYKKSIFDEVGGYNESLAYEDWDFLLKAQKRANFEFINEPLVKYRMHEHNMHKSLKNNQSYIDSTIQILFNESKVSNNVKVKENLAREICKMLIINESIGLKYSETFSKRYERNEIKDPLISVLITSYNTAVFVEASIKTMLFQSYSNMEIVFVDDGSTDSTLSILSKIKDLRLKVFNLEVNKGRVAALNYGISLCKGDYIALMDSDDMASPIRLERQYTYLVDNNLDAVSSQLFEFENAKDYSLSNFSNETEVIKVKMLFYNSIPHAATLFKSETLKKIIYREGFDFAEDYEMMSRYSMIYKLGLINEPLYLYRRRPGSATTGDGNVQNSLPSQKKIVRELFDQYLLNISNDELDLHLNLEKKTEFPLIKNTELLLQIGRWMHKVIRINKKLKKFDNKVLERTFLENYWSIYYYKNSNLHSMRLAINLFTLSSVNWSFLILKEGIKADIKKMMRKVGM